MKHLFLYSILLFLEPALRAQDTSNNVDNKDFTTIEAEQLDAILLDSFKSKSVPYAQFFTSADSTIYLWNNDDIVIFDSQKLGARNPTSMLLNTHNNHIEFSGYDRYAFKSRYNFIGLHKGRPENSIAFPHAPSLGTSIRPFIFSQNEESKLNIQKISRSLFDLGLQEKESYLDKASYLKVTTYDRLFLYELGDKILVAWHNNNELLANFMDREGNWLFTTPTLIHGQYYSCNPDEEKILYDHTLPGFLFSYVSDMDLSYDGASFYLTYQMHFSIPSLGLENHNTNAIVTVKLNDQLEVLTRIETLEGLSRKNDLLGNQINIQTLLLEDSLVRLVSSDDPENGSRQLVYQYLDQDLTSVTQKRLLTLSTTRKYKKYPVERLEDGYLISYYEKNSDSFRITSRKIYFDGRIGKPFHLKTPLELNPVGSFDYTTEVINGNIKYSLVFNHSNLSSTILTYLVSIKQFDE